MKKDTLDASTFLDMLVVNTYLQIRDTINQHTP